MKFFKKKFNFGLVAEYIVLLLYKIQFYKILHHRYKTYVGEIDLIVSRGSTLVFIEVKARRLQIDSDIITSNQQQRIHRTAELFVSKKPQYANYDLRFDLVIIRPYKLPQIIRNAW
ncbi:MAG: YraN family protein [Rickettsiaceae bacterium]|nr:YraN family protein [Rickettsiaceae bacterium]